jgi:hypothetical protein
MKTFTEKAGLLFIMCGLVILMAHNVFAKNLVVWNAKTTCDDYPSWRAYPGILCLPLKLQLFDTVISKHYGSYFTSPGRLKYYLADDIFLSYSASCDGRMLYYDDNYSSFRIEFVCQPNEHNIEQCKWIRASNDKNATFTESLLMPPFYVDRQCSLIMSARELNYPGSHNNYVFNFWSAVISGFSESSSIVKDSVYGSDFRIAGPAFHMTSEMVRDMVALGYFDEKFSWRYSFKNDSERYPDDPSFIEYNVSIRLEIGARDKDGEMSVSPNDGFKSSRLDPKQDFQPLSKTFTIKNNGDKPLEFAVLKHADWLNLEGSYGMIPPKGSVDVTAFINVSIANELSEDTYKDTILFINTTNGKGSSKRAAELTISEEQSWKVLLSGQETDDIGGKVMIMKVKDKWGNQVVEYGVRFDYRMEAMFTIMKKKGRWLYKDGRITASTVQATPSFDPDMFFIRGITCKNCDTVDRLVGYELQGQMSGDKVRLFWPRKIANAQVMNKLKIITFLADASKDDESMKGYSENEFFSECFFDYANQHQLALRDGEIPPFTSQRKSYVDQFRQEGKKPIHLYHRYVMKRIK